MKVKANRRLIYSGGVYVAGQVFECDDKQAAEWLASGAVASAPQPAATAAADRPEPGRYRRSDLRADK